MSEVMDDDVYSIDDLTEREIQKIEEDQERGSRTRYIFLSPSRKESLRTTNLRPIILKNNTYDQTKPMYLVAMHEGLDKLVPGTRRRIFPHINPNATSVVCLNDNDNENYCHVCKELPDLKQKNRDIQSQAESTGLQKDQTIARKMRMFWSKAKRTLFHFFVAVRRVGRVTEGNEWDKGKMPVKRDPEAITAQNKHGFVRCNREEVERWADPIGIVKWKDWWIEPFMTEVNRRKMGHQKFEETAGRKVSRAEFLRECPKSRPKGPFHPKDGYCVEVTVSGKGKDQNWKVTIDEAEPLTTGDKIAMLAAYPDLMKEIRPHGHDLVEEKVTWLEKNKGKTELDYAHYCKMTLAEAQWELLGLDKGSGVDDGLASADTNGEAPEVDEADMKPFSADGTTEDLDDFNIEDDIPFNQPG